MLLWVLRLVSAGMLLAILGALFVVLIRDYRTTENQSQMSRRTYGHLVVLAQIENQFVPTGAKYPLLPLTSFGRAPTNSVVIAQSFASSEHALITLKNGQWWLEDRNSTNGTLLNGESVTMPLIITDGDVVGVGNLYFQLVLE
jgi:hypothetical protein